MRTDLATESRAANPKLRGVTETVREENGLVCERITVRTEAAARRLDKPIGRYFSVTMPRETLFERDRLTRAAQFAAEELSALLPETGTVLVVGLGNRYITADALGTKTAEHILVTRHLRRAFLDVLPPDTRPVCSFCAGVLGVTGIETVEIVSAVAARLRPAAMVVVDSLAADVPEHLATVLQMNDTGIAPGAGVGNFRAVLNRETTGIPVIALGMPLVVGASALGGNAAEELFVTPKDVDLIVKNASKLLAETVNRALHAKNLSVLQNLLQ
ncbi:MAG: GPR endopeptidase [Clostridia bacterium]|nr:GPR endopeptidase [Clostridia bacterium]